MNSDFLVSGGDSVCLLRPLTAAAHEWCALHLDPQALHWGGAIAIEQRYIEPLLEGITVEGLRVEQT